MMFRHETDKVRFLNGDRDGTGTVFAKFPNPDERRSSFSRHRKSLGPDADISWALSPDAETQATCFFFRNYVLDEGSMARGFFDYLPAVYSQSRNNDILMDAVSAIGLAGLANYRRENHVMIRANLKYGRAVQNMSASLAKMERVKDDQTLIAVMLLGIYEVIPMKKILIETN